MEIVLKGRQRKSAIVNDNTVRIVKKGTIFSAQREIVLPIENITSVWVEKPQRLLAGFIQFSTVARTREQQEAIEYFMGPLDVVNDENTVLFDDDDQYELALEMKNYIRVHGQGAPQCLVPLRGDKPRR